MRKLTTFLLTAALLAGGVFAASASIAQEQGDWIVRGRLLSVTPSEKSTITPIGGAITAENVIVPELDFTYFVDDNVGVELILATTRHDIGAVGTTLGDLDIGKVSLLPPTLLVQYHVPDLGMAKPYFGAGINLTLFYNKDTDPAFVSTDYKNKLGFALQAGSDFEISEGTYFNVDVKKLFLSTDATVDAGALGIVTADVKLNPWIIGVGIGMKF